MGWSILTEPWLDYNWQ